MVNFYQVLGLPFGASFEEVRKAYRTHVKNLHPDKHQNSEYFTEKFKELQQAYNTLCDEKQKEVYDTAFFESNQSAEKKQLKEQLRKSEKETLQLNKLLEENLLIINALTVKLTNANNEIVKIKAESLHNTNDRKSGGASIQGAVKQKSVFGGKFWLVVLTLCFLLVPGIIFWKPLYYKYGYVSNKSESSRAMWAFVEGEPAIAINIINEALNERVGSTSTAVVGQDSSSQTSYGFMMFLRSDCKTRLGDTLSALRDITLSLENGCPAYMRANAFKHRGILRAHFNDTRGADNDFAQSLSLDPSNFETVINRAELFYKYKNWNYAAQGYQMARNLQPANDSVVLKLAHCYYFLGRKDSACVLLSRAGGLGNQKAFEAMSEYCE